MTVTENFTTGSDQELNAYTGWTRYFGSGVLGGFTATGTLGFTNSAGADSVYYYSGGSFADNQYVQVKVAALPSGATTCRPNLIVRWTSGDWVYCEFRNIDNTGAGTYTRISDNSGSLGDTTLTLAVNDVLRLEVSGTSVVLKQNGSTVITGTTSVTTGRPGLGGFNSTASNGWRVDDFEAGDIVTAPTAPTIGAADQDSPTAIMVHWTDNSSNEDTFEVQHRVTAGPGAWVPHTGIAANSTSYQVTGLTAATQYDFQVRAVNTGGNSAWSSTVQQTTATEGTYSAITSSWTPPSTPTLDAITVDSPTQITVDITRVSTHNTEGEIQRSLDGVTGWTTLDDAVAAAATSYVDTTASEGTTYYYRHRNTIGAVVSGWSNIVYATTNPAAPTIGAVTVGGPSTLIPTWTDNSSHEVTYELERRSPSGSGAYSLVSDVIAANSTSYPDTNLTSETNYGYRVRAVIDDANVSAWSSESAASTTATPIRPRYSPTAPVAVLGITAQLSKKRNRR